MQTAQIYLDLSIVYVSMDFREMDFFVKVRYYCLEVSTLNRALNVKIHCKKILASARILEDVEFDKWKNMHDLNK